MKKLLGFTLAALLVMASFGAHAVAVPSKTADDLTQVLPSHGASAQVVIVETGAAADAKAAVEAALAGIIATGAPVASYFPEDAQAAIGQVASVDTLEVNELLGLSFSGYTTGSGDVVLPVQFATPYQDGQVLVPVLGIVQADGSIQWHVLSAEVVDGVVHITIPGDVADLVGNQPVVLVMLSEKAN